MANQTKTAFSGLVGSCKKSTKHSSLPLKRVQLSIQTRCVLVSIEAVLEYCNDAAAPMEVEFVLPMDSVSVVTGLSARLEGREVRGVVKRKEEAKHEYEDAVSSGRTAVYGEEEGKDLFKMVLGNLSGGESAELTLSLLQEMEREETEDGETGALRFCLPTTLKPRYIPASPGAWFGIGPGVQYELSMGMVAEYAGGLSRVESPSHKISTGVVEGGQQWRVQLVDPNPLERDLVILLHPTQPSVPALLWGGASTSVKREEGSNVHPFTDSRSMMLSFLPQFGEVEREEVATEMVFLIDRSGSMRGKPIRSAGATLELLVRSLSPGCALNIVGFGSGYDSVFPGESRNYDEACVEKAVAYARVLQADMGGTEILSPLQDIFRQKKRPGLPRQVILLTDGDVDDREQVLQCVRENRGQVRVFAIGIGSGVSTALVRGVAEAGGGRAVFVSEGERMQGKILKLLSHAMTPCYTDVALSVSGEGLRLFPGQLPQLFPQDRLLVYGLLAPGISVEGHTISLQYKQGERKYSHLVSLDGSSGEAVSGEWVHKLCCSAVLREWEGAEEREEECVQLSCDTNLVCRHTALVGVDSEEGQIVSGSMQHIKLKPPFFNEYKTGAYIYGYARMNTGSSRGRTKWRGAISSRNPSHAPNFASIMPIYEAVPGGRGGGYRGGRKRRANTERQQEFGKEYRSRSKISPSSSKIAGPIPGGSTHEELISHQTAQGYWDKREDVDNLLQLSPHTDKLCPQGVGEREWTTLLCLLTLELKFSAFKDEWQLIAKKGWKWLKSSQLPVSLEVVTDAARQAVQ